MFSTKTCRRRVVGTFLELSLTVIVVSSWCAAPVSAQPKIDPLADPTAAARPDEETKEELQRHFSGSAPLKTDPDLEQLLRRASLFAEEGSYNHATTLWQKVLSECGDTLIFQRYSPELRPDSTLDDRTALQIYVSLVDEIERTIAKLPPDGLRVYRFTADGDAQATLAAAHRAREEALTTIVRNYFLSAHGDDAAYQLAGIALDRYDFVGATRLYRKILEQHPDPSISRGEVLLRLAIASAYIGDRNSAQKALEEAEKSSPRPNEQLLAQVKTIVEGSGKTSVVDADADGNWTTRWGNASRRGHMKSLSPAATEATLTKMWAYRFPLNFTLGSDQGEDHVFVRQRLNDERTEQLDDAENQMIAKWKAGHWMPAGQLLFADGRVYLKTNNDLSCWDAAADKSSVTWRTAWLNRFTVDSMTNQQMMIMRARGRNVSQSGQPTQAYEQMYFGDRVHQSMSIAGGVIYNLEGPRTARYGGMTDAPQVRQQQAYGYGSVPRRVRKNWLAAYDARNGKAIWYRSAMDKEIADANDVGFMAAPVAFGRFLLVPVTDGGAIWLYALSQDDGSTIWKSFLCDEPSGGCSLWSPVSVSVEGNDAYVATGAGAIFAVDAATGTIRFAVRYPRHGRQTNANVHDPFGGGAMPAMLSLKGWDDDIAIPYGRALVVMATDHDRLFAIDRRTGDLLWETPRTPFDHEATYCLGVADGGYFVGGTKCVRRYDIVSGRLIWEKVLEEDKSSYGRGALTSDAIYIPVAGRVEHGIAKLDLKTGEVVNEVRVATTTDEPIGNLFSDGEKLWVVAGNQVYALMNLKLRLAVLDQRVADGSAAAQIERMKLLANDGQIDKAIEDLRGAFAKMNEQTGATAAHAGLLDSLAQIQLSSAKPQALLDILAETYLDADDADASAVLTKQQIQQRADVIFAALRTIRKDQVPGTVASILRVAPLFSSDHELTMARQALKATAGPDDAARLREAVEADKPLLQIVAAEALAKLTKDESLSALNKLLASDDDRVHHAAARALANIGQRAALNELANLLESDDADVRLRSAKDLRTFTGQRLAFSAHDPADQRAQAVKAWRAWIEKEGQTANLEFPLLDEEPLLGRTLIAYPGQNLVVEVDLDGKVRWQETVSSPWAVHGLPNGHRLVASTAERAIVEFDAAGKEVWRKAGLPGQVFSVERLDNGNTLAACYTSQRVVEVNIVGDVVWEATIIDRPTDAHRLDDGNTLITLAGSGKVVELAADGKTITWEATGLPEAFSAERLENGNTLVVLRHEGRVVEVNRNGTTVWEKSKLEVPYDAQRLPNGNTLIAVSSGVIEVDSKGEVIRTIHDGKGAGGVSRF